MRFGDDRPFNRPEGTPLSRHPVCGKPFRWLPRHGQPMCTGELITQTIVKTFAFAPIYTAVIVTLVLLVLLFGVPWVND